MREYRNKNPEQRLKNAAYAAEWRKENPEKVREQWKGQEKRRSAKGPRVRHTTSPCVKCGSAERYPSGSCKACNRASEKRRQERDPEAFRVSGNERNRRYKEGLPAEEKRTRNRKHNLRKALLTYGLTMEQYETMLASQNGLCAICGGTSNGRSEHLHIDHDHATGKVRALLCHTCNTGVGLFNDDPELLQKVIAYLAFHEVGL